MIGSHPTEEGVDLFDGRSIEVWLASEAEESLASAAAADVPDVESSSAEAVDFDAHPASAEEDVEAVHDHLVEHAAAEAGGVPREGASASAPRAPFASTPSASTS